MLFTTVEQCTRVSARCRTTGFRLSQSRRNDQIFAVGFFSKIKMKAGSQFLNFAISRLQCDQCSISKSDGSLLDW